LINGLGYLICSISSCLRVNTRIAILRVTHGVITKARVSCSDLDIEDKGHLSYHAHCNCQETVPEFQSESKMAALALKTRPLATIKMIAYYIYWSDHFLAKTEVVAKGLFVL